MISLRFLTPLTDLLFPASRQAPRPVVPVQRALRPLPAEIPTAGGGARALDDFPTLQAGVAAWTVTWTDARGRQRALLPLGIARTFGRAGDLVVASDESLGTNLVSRSALRLEAHPDGRLVVENIGGRELVVRIGPRERRELPCRAKATVKQDVTVAWPTEHPDRAPFTVTLTRIARAGA